MQQTLRNLIADGKTKQAIAELRKFSFGDKEDNNQIIRLAASFATYERQSLGNEETPSVLRPELERINKALLVLIDGLDEKEDTGTKSHKTYRRVNKMPQSEQYHLKSLDIYERLSKNNPQQFEPDLATTAMNLGIFYETVNQISEAEKYYLKSLDIYERLTKSNPQQFEPYLALILNNYGWFNVDVKQYDKAQKLYNRALTLRQKALLSSFAHYESEYNRVFSNYGQLRDTFASQNNYTKAFEIQTKCVQSIEILRGVLENGDTRAAQEYGSLSWYALFEIEFTVAKNAARRGLELDATQTWIKSNLAHALLFQNNNAEAKIMYDALKTQKDAEGKSFRNALNADFDALEQAGLDKKQLDKARKWVAAE